MTRVPDSSGCHVEGEMRFQEHIHPEVCEDSGRREYQQFPVTNQSLQRVTETAVSESSADGLGSCLVDPPIVSHTGRDALGPAHFPAVSSCCGILPTRTISSYRDGPSTPQHLIDGQALQDLSLVANEADGQYQP